MSEGFSADVLAKLNAPLDPKRVTTMPAGPAAGVPYLESHDVIETANRIFGFGNWGFELVGQPWAEHGPSDKPYTVWMAIGKLTVRGGMVFSDMGTNLQSGVGGAATEMASKGAVSDAMKRCLRLFGQQFGLVLYDKSMDRAALEREYAHSQQGASAVTAPPDAAPPLDLRAEQILAGQEAVWDAFYGQCKAAKLPAKMVCAAFNFEPKSPQGAADWFEAQGPASLAAWLDINPDKTWQHLVARLTEQRDRANEQTRETAGAR